MIKKNAQNLMKHKKNKNLLVMFCAGQNRSTVKCYKQMFALYLKVLILSQKNPKKTTFLCVSSLTHCKKNNGWNWDLSLEVHFCLSNRLFALVDRILVHAETFAKYIS